MTHSVAPPEVDENNATYERLREELQTILSSPEAAEALAKGLVLSSDGCSYRVSTMIAKQFLSTPLRDETGHLNTAIKSHIDATTAKVKSGDLSDLETLLVGQAYLLNSIFESLMEKGTRVEDIQNSVRVMDCAMKAQKQSRQIVQTLNEMKNPRRTQIVDKQFNQMVVKNNAQMDARCSEITGSENPPMETMGTEQWAEDSGGEAGFKSELT